MQSRSKYMIFRYAPLLLCLVISVVGCSRSGKPFPHTERKPVTDVYHGVTVTDDYRWLDDIRDPAVRQWVDEQNAYCSAYFNSMSSLRSIQNRLKELY